MLAKLLSTITRRESDQDPTERQPADLAPEAMRFEPMVPLHPPAAQNDDVMGPVYEEVETALRASGHLR